MIIMDPVAGIEIHRPGAVVEFAIRDDRLQVPMHRVAIVAALDVDMGRHVHQVAHVGRHLAQPVTGDQRRLRMRRHLHQMDVQVQQARMAPSPPANRERRTPAPRAPPASRRRARVRRCAASHICQGVRFRIASTKMRRSSRSLGCARCTSRMRVGESVVPGRWSSIGVALRIAGGQRLDQRALRRGDATGQRKRGARGVIASGQVPRPCRRDPSFPRDSCSSDRPRRRRPNAPWHSSGRPPALFQSRRRPPRGGSQNTS